MIRHVLPADLEHLIPLIRLFPSPTAPNEEYTRDNFGAVLSNPRAYLAVAVEVDGTLVGYLSGYRHATFYASGETAWCDEVFVREDCRCRGIGTLLMGAFELWAIQHGCILVSLATAGAKEFYESLGYASKASYYKKYLSKG